jgi:hypothetical protein
MSEVFVVVVWLASSASTLTVAVEAWACPDEARLRFDPESSIADGRWPYNY